MIKTCIFAVATASLLVNPFIKLNNHNISSIISHVISENERELNNISNRQAGDKEPNSWSIGSDGKWVAYDKNLNLVKGLIYDRARDSYFLTGFESGNLVYENGLYEINGSIVHLTFSSNRTGTYGKIESGIDMLREILK